jgi:hypothetical protein
MKKQYEGASIPSAFVTPQKPPWRLCFPRFETEGSLADPFLCLLDARPAIPILNYY